MTGNQKLRAGRQSLQNPANRRSIIRTKQLVRISRNAMGKIQGPPLEERGKIEAFLRKLLIGPAQQRPIILGKIGRALPLPDRSKPGLMVSQKHDGALGAEQGQGFPGMWTEVYLISQGDEPVILPLGRLEHSRQGWQISVNIRYN